MRQTIVKLFILVAFNLVLGSASDQLKVSSGGDEDSDNHVEDLTAMLYSSDKAILEPNETFELLGKLEAKLRTLNDNDSISKYSKIMSLINAKQVSENYCNSYRGGLERLIQNNSIYPNIKTYLDSISSQQVKICKNLLDESLRQNVGDISENRKEEVELLKDSIKVNDRQRPIGIYQEPTDQAINEGFLLYLERRFGPLTPKLVTVTKEQGEKLYRGYSDRVFTLCRFITKKLEKVMLIHERFFFDEKELDKSAVDWLENGLICKAIRSKSDSVFRDSYQILLDKLKDKSKKINETE